MRRTMRTETKMKRAEKGNLMAQTLERSEPLTERVAETIRRAILAGQLPPGTRLSVPKIARQLGVSRTPAREALLVLERDGLIGMRSSNGMEVLSATSGVSSRYSRFARRWRGSPLDSLRIAWRMLTCTTVKTNRASPQRSGRARS